MQNKTAKYHYIDNAFRKKRKLFQKLIEVNEQARMRRQFFSWNFVNIGLKLQTILLFMIYFSHLFLVIDRFINHLKLCGYIILVYRQF
jgi:hypothetical protein